MVIGDDLEDGLVSRPFTESEPSSKQPEDLVNSIGGRGKYLTGTGPDVRTLVDATQGAPANISGSR